MPRKSEEVVSRASKRSSVSDESETKDNKLMKKLKSSSEEVVGRAIRRKSSTSDDKGTTDYNLMKKFKSLKFHESEEAFVQILLQVLFPYLVAGVGMVAAGSVLNHVKHWEVFQHISEVIILVPALLGLKGNLEMTLAARLSTQANLGTMDSPGEFYRLVSGNISLTLCQALVVGFLASVLALCFSLPQKGYIEGSHALLLTASCMTTAFLSSVVLGLLMCGVVYSSRVLRIDPDNVATPVAGSLGDLIAISVLAKTSDFFYGHMDTIWLSSCIIMIMCISLPLWWHISSRNEYSRDALHSGWNPIISAMTISTLGGVILDNTIVHYDGLARFQPVINGIGGNLVAIQASRLSTSLHRLGPIGTDLSLIFKQQDSWQGSFCRQKLGSKSARALLTLVIPGHFLFALLVWFCHSDDVEFLRQTRNASFLVFYLLAAFFQVALLLHMAHGLVSWQWSRCLDPDTTSIPYLTAIGDLLGIIFLALAFYIHNSFDNQLDLNM